MERQRFVDMSSWRNQLYPFRKTKLVQTGEPQNGTVLETLRSRPGMLRVRVQLLTSRNIQASSFFDICPFEGLRACAVNGGAEYLTHEAPDVLCLQVLALSHGHGGCTYTCTLNKHNIKLIHEIAGDQSHRETDPVRVSRY